MFIRCSSLTTAPELPATTLASYCYYHMFYYCSSLIKTPELPAETLVKSCYYYMFGGCHSLTEVPMISAKTHASSSCSYMFYECNQLNSVKVNFTSWNESNHSSWMAGVSSSGTFYKPDELPEEFGTSKIPEGWTVKSINESTEPEEPSTPDTPTTDSYAFKAVHTDPGSVDFSGNYVDNGDTYEDRTVYIHEDDVNKTGGELVRTVYHYGLGWRVDYIKYDDIQSGYLTGGMPYFDPTSSAASSSAASPAGLSFSSENLSGTGTLTFEDATTGGSGDNT